MKKMFRESKRGGIRALYAKRQMKLIAGVLMLFAVIATMCFMSGTDLGMVAGLACASAPLVAFKLPSDVEFSENEKKGLNALANHFTEQFNQFAKGQQSQEEFVKAIEKTLEGKGFSEEAIKSIKKSLEDQGTTLTSLKERANGGGATVGGLKSAFDANYDKLVTAIKGKDRTFQLKAIDEHDTAKIHMTSNTIVAQNGAQVEESIGVDPTLHLKRRARQYIRDIVNVTKVGEVPETYTFYEEGDETGAIAIVEENGLKPQVKLGLIKNQVDAKKAAGYIVVTEEMMKWRPRMWAAIQRLFQDKVMRDYENILTDEMMVNASAYISTELDGTIVKPTDFDALVAAILQLETLEFVPDVLVINPADKWRLALTETSNGMFILPYIQNGGQFALLGLNVKTSNKVKAGEFILGESGTWFIEEENPQLRTGLVNDDLIHNRMTIVGEIFFLSYVPSNNKGSFVKGVFADIKEALTKA